MASTFYFRRGSPYARASVGTARQFGRTYRTRYVAPAFADAAPAPINATGALAVGSITATASGIVAVNGSGVLAVIAITASASAGVALDATGSLAVQNLSASASAAVVVTGSGSLAVASILAHAGADSPIDATGSLGVESLSVGASAAVVVAGSGGLTVDSIAALSGSIPPIEATGALVVDSLTAVGAGSFDGADAPGALASWWAAQTAIQALTTDGRLWHFEAAEGVDPPYLTFFVASESELPDRTTGYAYVEAVVQFSAHGRTDVEAAAIRKAVRKAILNAPLSIDGTPVRHSLPGDQALLIGEGFGPHGADCWIATVDVSIPWQADALD